MVLCSNFFNGNLTSPQSEGASATSTNPLPFVSLKKKKRHVTLTKRKEKAVIFHQIGNVPSFFVNRGMEFLFAQKIKLMS